MTGGKGCHAGTALRYANPLMMTCGCATLRSLWLFDFYPAKKAVGWALAHAVSKKRTLGALGVLAVKNLVNPVRPVEK